MTAELWASIITTIVVPIVLRILVHYFPWLADVAVPGTGEAVKPAGPTPEPDKGVYDIEEDGS